MWKPWCCWAPATCPAPATRCTTSLFGNTGDNTLNGGAAPTVSRAAGNDTFVFNALQANGDTIARLRRPRRAERVTRCSFLGYGTAAQGATFTQVGATNQWTIHSGLGGSDEMITLMTGATVDASDFLFT